MAIKNVVGAGGKLYFQTAPQSDSSPTLGHFCMRSISATQSRCSAAASQRSLREIRPLMGSVLKSRHVSINRDFNHCQQDNALVGPSAMTAAISRSHDFRTENPSDFSCFHFSAHRTLRMTKALFLRTELFPLRCPGSACVRSLPRQCASAL